MFIRGVLTEPLWTQTITDAHWTVEEYKIAGRKVDGK